LTSISDILKPKSLDELTEAVKKMHPFDFVDKFRRRSIKGMKVGFKKQITYFLAVTYIKHFSKIYWPIWGTWVILMICTWIWKEFQLLNTVEDIFNWIIIGSLLPTMISACLNLYITRWVEKHQRQLQHGQINDIVNNIQQQIQQRLIIEEERRRVQEEANEISRQIEEHRRLLRQRQDELDLLRGNLRNL
jgi:hypothetical protein